MLAVSVFYISRSFAFPGFYALMPIVGSFLLISAGPDAWFNKKILSNRLFVSIGLISYPLYLWHWPLLSFLRIGISDGTYRDVSAISRIAAIIVAVVLSFVTYKWIEKPIRFGGEKRVKAGALSVAMVGLVAFSAFVYVGNGLPNRVNIFPPASHVLFEPYPHPLKNQHCEMVYPELKNEWSCLLSKPEKATVAIIGDSHAHQYYQSLARKLPNESVLNFSAPGCLPFSIHAGCDNKIDQVIRLIRENDSIKTVILSGYFSFLISDFKYGNIEGLRVANSVDNDKIDIFKERSRALLTALASLKRNVVVFVDIPDLVFKPRSCVSFQNSVMALLRAGGEARDIRDCGLNKSEFEVRNNDHDKVLDEVVSEFDYLNVFNARDVLCNDGFCGAYRDGIFLYWNSDHLTIEGSDLVIDALLQSKNGDLFQK